MRRAVPRLDEIGGTVEGEGRVRVHRRLHQNQRCPGRILPPGFDRSRPLVDARLRDGSVVEPPADFAFPLEFPAAA
jgi:hypothetical protein